MVKPDNTGHGVINFRYIRLVDFSTQNLVLVGDSFIWSRKSMEFDRFLQQVAVHRNEIIGIDEFG